MTVYVDDWFQPAKLPGMRPAIWSHLYADTVSELHLFASRLGLRREWFQDKESLPHYDVTKNVRARAIALGAVSVSWRDTGRFIMNRRKEEG